MWDCLWLIRFILPCSKNIDEWGRDLDIPIDEVRIFHALRESAGTHFHNPWLVSYIRTTRLWKSIRIDIDTIQRQAQEVFDAAADNAGESIQQTESFTMALNEGIFTRRNSSTTRSANKTKQFLRSSMDGQTVVTLAAGDRLPNILALQEICAGVVLRQHQHNSSQISLVFKFRHDLHGRLQHFGTPLASYHIQSAIRFEQTLLRLQIYSLPKTIYQVLKSSTLIVTINPRKLSFRTLKSLTTYLSLILDVVSEIA